MQFGGDTESQILCLIFAILLYGGAVVTYHDSVENDALCR
jgi:hypothetical protein